MADLVIYPTAKGTYLEFQTKGGELATIGAEELAESLPDAARQAMLKWCEEIQFKERLQPKTRTLGSPPS